MAGLSKIQTRELVQPPKKPLGPTVTNAKAGESLHNYGVAIDVQKPPYGAGTKKIDKSVADVAKTLGFEWGGDWPRFKDYPHFENRLGYKNATELQTVAPYGGTAWDPLE